MILLCIYFRVSPSNTSKKIINESSPPDSLLPECLLNGNDKGTNSSTQTTLV